MTPTAAPPEQNKSNEFDQFASNYDAILQQGLSVSGESKEYFAEGRVQFLKKRLELLGFTPKSVLDYGCGIGTSVPLLHNLPGVELVQAVDISHESIASAKSNYQHPQRCFTTLAEFTTTGSIDLSFCNGVFHHIPLDQRAIAVKTVFDSLRPGGLFAYWENNPWNPATRYVMSRIPFDKDAITLTPFESRTMLSAGGFEVISTHYLFIFPKMLSWFRPIEQTIATWPVGTQYQILCRKPS